MLGKNTILKAIHNIFSSLYILSWVWMLGKNTILKAIHNWRYVWIYFLPVWMLGKNTILKAIHNNVVFMAINSRGVNAG